MDGTILSGEERMIKPDPNIYSLLCNRFSLVPHETLFIDDTLKNIEAAKEHGLQAVHFKDRDQRLAELNSMFF